MSYPVAYPLAWSRVPCEASADAAFRWIRPGTDVLVSSSLSPNRGGRARHE